MLLHCDAYTYLHIHDGGSGRGGGVGGVAGRLAGRHNNNITRYRIGGVIRRCTDNVQYNIVVVAAGETQYIIILRI